MVAGKTNVSSNSELDGHVTNFKSQLAEVVSVEEALGGYREALEQVEVAESRLMAAWGETIKDWNNLENFLQNAEVRRKKLAKHVFILFVLQGVRQQRLNNLASLEQEVQDILPPSPRQVVVPLRTYRHQFYELKGRVDKCEARRAAFDRCLGRDQVELNMAGPPSWPGRWRGPHPRTAWRPPGHNCFVPTWS
jgi:hypothetical protein